MSRHLLSTICTALLWLVPSAGADAQQPVIQSENGMVVTSQHLASDVGAAVLRKGGNAIDAAVAVGYALAVVHPCCGNIGGGGFMLIHLADGRDTFINFREKAPLAATRDMYLDASGNVRIKASIDGFRAAGTPGSVAGLEYARAHYGSQPRPALIAPAIALARNGFVLDEGDAYLLERYAPAFVQDPGAAKIFLNNGRAWRAGERLVQSDLARTLAAISRGGASAFYTGPVARAIVDGAKSGGGILSLDDLAKYTVSESGPISCEYRGRKVLLPPPPSSGGITICEMLGIVSGYPPGSVNASTAEGLHVLTEAARRAFFDRNSNLGDPDFVTNPTRKLLSADYIAEQRAGISSDHATPSASLGATTAPSENGATTHYSVVDRWGNAVSVTYTINDGFGAKVVAPTTGFFLNDEMDDFTAKPGTPNQFDLVQGSANAIAPGKRPLSSMAPAIVLDQGRPVIVVGAAGGARIITTVFGIITGIIDRGLTAQDAVDAPRWHHQWLPDTLALEPGALDSADEANLRGKGHIIVPLERWGTANAAEAIVAVRGDNGKAVYTGVNDARAISGSAAAP